MDPNARRTRLLDELAAARNGRLRVDALAKKFEVSERTVRYDLRYLEGRGVRFDLKPGKSGGVRLSSVPEGLQLRYSRQTPSSLAYGYHAESLAMNNLILAARRGTGAVVVVSGEAGIGKTRLCRTGIKKAENLGFNVYSATAQEATRDAPLRPWVQLINGIVARRSQRDIGMPKRVASRLGALVKSLPQIGDGVRSGLSPDLAVPRNSAQLTNAVAETLLELVREEPTVFLFDDIQWADSQSLEVLLLLSDFCHSSPLLVMATARAPVRTTAPPALSALLAQRETGLALVRIELRGLDYVESGLLLSSLTSVPESDSRFDEMLRIARGNPLFIRELGLHNSRVGAAAGRVELPSVVDGAIAERLAPLSDECQSVLTSASIVGSEFNIELLGTVTDQSHEALFRALTEALHQQVIDYADDTRSVYRFAHPLIYRHIYFSIEVGKRQFLHSRLARFLMDTPVMDEHRDPALVLHHLQESGTTAERSQVAKYSIEVGERELESFTFQSATDHFKIAVDLSEGDDATYGRACKGMALASSGLDDLSGVQRWNREAIPSLIRAKDHTRAVEASQLGGSLADPQTSLDLARMVLDAVPTSFPGRASPLSTYGWMHGWVEDRYDYEAACRYLTEAIQLAGLEGDENTRCLAIGRLTQIKYLNLDIAGCIELVLEGLDLARHLAHPERESHFLVYAIQVSIERGDLATAESYASATYEAAERSGSAFRLRGANWSNASIRHARDRGMTVDELYRETSEHMAQLPLASVAVCAAERLDSAGAETLARFRLSLPFTVRSTSQNASTPEVLSSVACVFEDSSLLRFDRPLRPNGSFPNDSPISLRNRLIAIGLAAAIDGDIDAARWAYEQLASKPLVPDADCRSAPIEQVLGMIAAGSGAYGNAFLHFNSSIEKARASGLMPTMAWSLVHGLRSAIRCGMRSEASSLAKWIPLARSFLTEHGLRLIARRLDEAVTDVESTWPSALTPSFGLTTREIEVLRLVADGLTNEQIAASLLISASTVASHIESVLAKTGAANRVQAARLFLTGHLSANTRE